MVYRDYMVGGLFGGSLGAFFAAYFIIAMIVLLGVYIYSSYALMTIAKKLKSDMAWVAWIPIVNLYLLVVLAEAPLLSLFGLLFVFVPFIGGILIMALMVYWYWLLCEKMGFSGYLSLLALIPFFGILILLGILAWAAPDKMAMKKLMPTHKQKSRK